MPDMVRPMMTRDTLPNSLWVYALEMTAYILNLVPTKKLEKTQFEMWKGTRPSLAQIRVWVARLLYIKNQSKN